MNDKDTSVIERFVVNVGEAAEAAIMPDARCRIGTCGGKGQQAGVHRRSYGSLPSKVTRNARHEHL
jgi:hypothetical protein